MHPTPCTPAATLPDAVFTDPRRAVVRPRGPRIAGGAHALYQVCTDPAGFGEVSVLGEIAFQAGPVASVGVVGWTNEALLAVVIDRLDAFQKGPFHCEQNTFALGHLRAAMVELEQRSADRRVRGVEGRHEA